MSSVSSQMNLILKPGGLTVLFQPIFELREDGLEVYGLEGLVRGPQGTHLEAADVLFDYVRRKGEEITVDRACVAAILKAAGGLPGKPCLAINVHAATLGGDREFVAFLRRTADSCAIRLSRVAIEIVEHAPPWEGPGFLSALDRMRQLGIRIALDDVGLGDSNYRMMLDCRPDLFKVDAYLVRGCSSNGYRHAVLESIVQLAHRLGAKVAAEGIEDPEDLRTVAALGVDLAQGFLLARPMPAEWFTAGAPGAPIRIPAIEPVWSGAPVASGQTLEERE